MLLLVESTFSNSTQLLVESILSNGRYAAVGEKYFK